MAYNTGATFYPGGEDSYYIPEVISPAPQRLNEHPTNMEHNVASMEQQAASRNVPRLSTQSVAGQPGYGAPWSPASPGPTPFVQQPQQQYHSGQQRAQVYQSTHYGQANLKPPPEQPNFSNFPRLPNRGNNIPPTPEEQEALLEAAREAVLSSDDVDMQLTWAQDALSYCEIAIQNEQRISQTQPARPRTPRVEHMLREDAMKIVEFLAEQSQPKAEFMRGMWLEFGKFGYRIDKREAFNCYTRASERGYARAYYRIGMQFENSNDALKAVKYYQMGLNLGDAASSYRLGMMTLLGQHGQPQDFERGLQLIYTAANAADDNAPQGAYVLGMLQNGELPQVNIPERILPRNAQQAKTNIEKAAFLGFAKAQVRMGAAYELGDIGCSFDAALSLHYNSLAARQGEVDAEMAISKWFLCGQEAVFVKNEEMAFTYAQRAAVGGLATAQFAMGYFYEVGIYVTVDLKQAREWYSKAAENGNDDASKRINAISRSKTISRKEHENVALQKIRDQHASASAAPAAQEAPYSPTLDMPDPSKLSLNSNPPVQRPASAAPYPTEGPNMAPNPNYRPVSAFGLNPALQQRQNYGAPGPAPRQDQYRVSSAPGPQQRPYANIDAAASGPGYGRGGNPHGPAGPVGPGYQYGNSNQPNPRPSSASSHPGPQGRPPQQYQGGPNAPGGQQIPQIKMDIGFSAPLDMTGADRRDTANRRPLPSQQAGPPPNSGRPPRMDSHGPPSSGAGSSRPSASQSYQSSQSQQKPQQQKPYPSNSSSVQPARLEPSRPPRVDSATPKPNQQKPATVSASAAPSKPPGKGPKTFEEMGVPQAQKEGDCIVM